MFRSQQGGAGRPSGPAGAAPGRGSGGEVKKKMAIKPFKVQPSLPAHFEDDSWEKLKAAIVAVHKREAISFSREELYRTVEDLCVHKMGARLYERLRDECDKHVEATVKALENQETDHELFLQKVDDAWQGHCDLFLTIRSIFLYLDRSYVMQLPNLLSIWELGLSQFRHHLQSRGTIEHKTVQGLLAMIARERNGETVNRGLLRNLTRMLTNLGTYKDVFLPPFLEESEQYFSREGVKKMESSDVPTFLRHVESRLREASEAVVQYLEPGTKKPLMLAIEQQLLKPHTSALVEKGFDALVDTNRKEDLHLMYKLFIRVAGAVDELKKAFNSYLRRKGQELVEDTNRDKELIEDLLAFKGKADALLEASFERADPFSYSVKDAFEYILNVKQSRTAELLAKYVDGKLKGEKGIREEDVELVLDRVMVLFRYIGSKDVFEAFYKKDLSKRLLLGRSASSDLEKSMVGKLKAECGATFTNKLEGMFKDMDLSRELMANYTQSKEAAEGRASSKVEMLVQVLTTGFWPTYPVYEVIVPPQLAEHMERFNRFYMNKYQGRRLVWQHAADTLVIKARFPAGTKELSLSFYQGIVLMCFNATDTLPFLEIKARTNIEEEELKRTLQSLACAKPQQRVLHKEPKGKDVGKDDVFHLNKEFSHKLYRIKINTIQLKETVEEVQKTHEGVFQERAYSVDAAIVRIMKARKTLTHQLLISELLGQLKFPARPVDLKKRIESLIEREYLERDESSPQIYRYLA